MVCNSLKLDILTEMDEMNDRLRIYDYDYVDPFNVALRLSLHELAEGNIPKSYGSVGGMHP
jgi:hypothetical protein